MTKYMSDNPGTFNGLPPGKIIIIGENNNTLAINSDGIIGVNASENFDKYYYNYLDFTNPTYGKDINQDGALGGTPEEVHDGTDTSLWTASDEGAGTWDFAGTTDPKEGSKCIDGTGTLDGAIAQFDRGSSLSMASYAAFSGWIKYTSAIVGTQACDIYGYDTGTSLMVGNEVCVCSYVDRDLLNVWQKFVIPKDDLGLNSSSIDAIRFEISATASAPNFYLDQIQIEETGTPVTFTLTPTIGTTFYIYTFDTILAAPYTGLITVAGATENATTPNIPYDTLLGVSLTNGITYRSFRANQPVDSRVLLNFLDYIETPGGRIAGHGCNGINTWVKLRTILPFPTALNGDNNDYMTITVGDDLSSMLRYRSSVSGKFKIN